MTSGPSTERRRDEKRIPAQVNKNEFYIKQNIKAITGEINEAN
jgi:hypothetical protein